MSGSRAASWGLLVRRQEVFIFAAALSVRLVLVLIKPDDSTAETLKVALSLLRNGAYADAYGPGVGPTAHCAPLLPLVLAATVGVFGTGRLGHFAMAMLASIAASLAFAILPRFSYRCGLGRTPGLVAGIGGALFPVNFWVQTSGLFDAPYTALALLVLCWIIGGHWLSASFPARGGALFGVAAGVAGLLSPMVLPVICGWACATLLRFHRKLGELLLFWTVAAACTIAVFSPWAIRNRVTLGRFVWTRSNFGLEFQISNDDHSGPIMDQNVLNATAGVWRHPFINGIEREKVKRIGELAYMEAKKAEAVQWIRSHPFRFMRLAFERTLYFWFPPMQRPWQTLPEAAISVFGIVGLVHLRRNAKTAPLFVAAVLTYPLVYLLIEVSPRYRFPMEPFLLLTGAYWLCSRQVIWQRMASFGRARLASSRKPMATGGVRVREASARR